MAVGRYLFKPTTVKRLIRAAEETGLTVTHVAIDADGGVHLTTTRRVADVARNGAEEQQQAAE
jgi:hypothetical protein